MSKCHIVGNIMHWLISVYFDRWDNQRVREETMYEKLKDREHSVYKKKQKDPVESFYSRLEDSKYMTYPLYTN